MVAKSGFSPAERGPIARYFSVIRTPHVAVLALSAFVAYLAYTAMPLATIFLIHGATGSFAVAGSVSAGRAIGAMICAPLRGRLVDTRGQTPVLVSMGILYTAALVGLTVATLGGSPSALLVLLAGVVGASFPPVFACMRSLWSSLYTGQRLRAAYALESMLQHLALIGGPLLAGGLIAAASPSWAIVVLAVIMLSGTLAFAATPVSRSWRPQPREGIHTSALASPGLRTLVGSLGLSGIALGVVQVGIPAFAEARGRGPAAGVLLALAALGGVAGGLWYGSRDWRQPNGKQFPLLLALAAPAYGSLLLARSIPEMAGLMVVAGVLTAPLAICSFHLLDELAPSGTGTEAFTWLTSASMAGIASGAALTGALVEAVGVRPAFLVAAVVALLASALAYAGRYSLTLEQRARPWVR